MIDLLWEYRADFGHGLRVSAMLFLGVASLGTFLGVLLAVASRMRVVRVLMTWCAMTVLSVPVIVLLYWGHLPLQGALRIVVDPFWTAFCVLTCVHSAVVYVLTQPALESVRGQWDWFVRMYAIRPRSAVRQVYLPLVLRAMGPSFVQSLLGLTHLSLLAGFINVPELFRAAQRVAAQERGQAIAVYTAMAVLFAAASLPVWLASSRWQARIQRSRGSW